MIPNVVKGGNMYGLINYLQGPGKVNEHESPHVVGGDDFLQVWYGTETLEKASVAEITDYLEEPRKRFGTKVTAQVTEQDPVTGEKRVTGYRDAHVWHCSLSLSAEEGALSNEKWQQIASEFMDEMGFTEASGKSPARWVAIHHGASSGGNDHIHIAASMVREDGTRWNAFRDFKKAQEACRGIEQRHGLASVAGPGLGLGERGEKPAERASAARDGRSSTVPKELAERVRAAAVGSLSEAEWIQRVRGSGMVVKPFFAKGTTDVVTGYRVSLKPARDGGRFAFYGGKTLGQDLSLPRLRELWAEPGLEQASAAAAEWQAAFKGQPSPGKVSHRPVDEQSAAQRFAGFNERLVMTPHHDRAAWADAARDVSGALSAWAGYDRDRGPELRKAAATLARSAQYRRPAVPPGRVVSESPMGTANLFLMAAAAGNSKVGGAMLMRQVLTTGRALAAYHRAAGDLGQAQALQREVVERLEHVQLRGYPVGGAVAVVERPPVTHADAQRAKKIAGAFGGGGPLPNRLAEPRKSGDAERPKTKTKIGNEERGNRGYER